MEELRDDVYSKIFNFDETKRKEWEEKRKPYSVLFELTPRCNMNCVHCYLQNHHEAEQLSYDSVIKIIDLLYEKGILFLTLTGGDVFTRTDFANIYLYTKKKGFIVEIFTNGELITDDMILLFTKYPPLLVDVSIYGSNDITYRLITGKKGAFERVINNCKKMKKAGIRVSIKTPVLKQTYGELDEMKSLAEKLGIPFAYSFELIPTLEKDTFVFDMQLDYESMLKREFNDFDKLSEGEKNYALTIEYNKALDNGMKPPLFICNIARNSFLIDYKGNLCPCMKFRHRGINLLNNDFDLIWEDYSKYREIEASSQYKCANCKARFQCSICPAEMDFMYNNMEFVPQELCKLAYARYAFYHEKKSVDEALAFLK